MSVSKFGLHVLKKHNEVGDVIVKEGEAERQDKGETYCGDLQKTKPSQNKAFHKTKLLIRHIE